MLDQKRMNNVLEKLSSGQMLITDPLAVFWLTGKWFYPGERFFGLLIAEGKEPVLFVNELFRFDEEIGVRKVYYSDGDDAAALVGRETDHNRILGVDKIMEAKFLLPMMDQKIASGFVNGSAAVDYSRAVKDAHEIELMKEASRINDEAMLIFKTLVKEGIKETEIADQMLDIYKKLGASAYSFEPIVAFGKNAADPHHMPDDTRLKEGDIVLFDVGCIYENYCSDMTRVFFFKKEPDEKARYVYNLVRKANEEAEAMLKPGIRIGDIDKKARDIITEGGYGKDFTHRLGHFIGIQDHEFGDVAQTNDRLTEPGNIFSIEPGIYNPEAAGVRIEDLVLITEDGYEVLNHVSKDIEVIG